MRTPIVPVAPRVEVDDDPPATGHTAGERAACIAVLLAALVAGALTTATRNSAAHHRLWSDGLWPAILAVAYLLARLTARVRRSG
jgi:hypothetical protein